MKYILIFLLLSAGPLFGLDAEAIRKLAKQPHSRENLVEALKIFPEAREYRVTGRMADPGGDWQLDARLGHGPLPSEPDVSILLAVEDTHALEQGRLRLVEALVTGGIKMSGDVTLLLRIQGLLRDLG